MASWKKVLTDGDNTNIANTDLTADGARVLTLANSASVSVSDSSFVLKGGTGTVMQVNTVAGISYAVSFSSAFYEVNAILSLSGQSTVGGRMTLYHTGTSAYTDPTGATYVGLEGPTNAVTSRFYKLPETKPTNDGEFWLGNNTESGSPPVNDTYWSTGLEYDTSNKELKLNNSLVKPLPVGGGRSGTLLDSDLIDGNVEAIGEFIHLTNLSSSTFATERVFNVAGGGASLANADTEAKCTNMLVWNNIAQTSSTTLTALRKGVAAVQSSLVAGSDSFAEGDILYLDNGVSDGLLTLDRPTTSGHFVRHVGYGLREENFGGTDHIIFVFDPSPDFIKLT